MLHCAAWAQEPPIVTVARPQPAAAHQSLRLPGNVVAYERTSLYAKVTGYLEEVRVDIGDRVQKDQILAILTIPEMVPELMLAEAELMAGRARAQKAEAEHALSKITHERLASLRQAEPGALTSQDLDVAAAKEKLAAAQVEIARSDIEVAQARVAQLTALMEYATIRAPFKGVVTGRFADPGALAVASDTGSKPILEVARTDRLRLLIDIPEKYVPYIGAGHKIEFALDVYPGRSFESPITRVAGVLAPDTRSMRAEVDVDGRDGLVRPGMYATVRIPLAEIPRVLAVPAAALRTVGGRTFVFAVKDGRAMEVPAVLLLDDGAQIVIAGDLDPHSPVIVGAPPHIEHGQPVVVEGGP